MPRIFISYRRQDTPGYAGRLSDDLRDRFGPDQVFMDIDTLRPGADFVEAIQNPDNERHEELLEWIGGRFDPEEFDAAKATKAIRKGLPDWRSTAGW